MNVFLDTNVLMDVLLERKPFVVESRRIWFLAERGKIRGLIAAMTFPTLYYRVRKVRGVEEAKTMLSMLRSTLTPVVLDAQILNQALDARFADFEDALQYFSALRADAACLVTRNPAHFPQAGISILSPAEFLAVYSFDRSGSNARD
jgi:predicted nucleic acid-binding protein